MGIRKYKPTTPGGGARAVRTSPRSPGVSRRSRSSAAARQGRPERARPSHRPAPGWRSQARLPGDRLPARRQGRRAGQGRAHRVRPEPHRSHRAAALRRRREALHPGARTDCAKATGSRTGSVPTSSRATASRCALSRPAPSCTRLSFGRVAAPRSRARLAPACSCSPRKASYAQLRMPSGEIRRVDANCRATVGEVGNAEQGNIKLGKAGRSRWKGSRPTVRGVAMNPIDHPHGRWRGQDLRWSAPGQPVGQAGRPYPAGAQGQATSSSSAGASKKKR